MLFVICRWSRCWAVILLLLLSRCLISLHGWAVLPNQLQRVLQSCGSGLGEHPCLWYHIVPPVDRLIAPIFKAVGGNSFLLGVFGCPSCTACRLLAHTQYDISVQYLEQIIIVIIFQNTWYSSSSRSNTSVVYYEVIRQ